jgi:hypothetical protein
MTSTTGPHPGCHLESDRNQFGNPIRFIQNRKRSNLIENAIQHTPSQTTMTAAIKVMDNNIHIEITDNGPGIPDEAMLRVFDRFVRLDTSRTHDGNELGLRDCFRIRCTIKSCHAFDSRNGPERSVPRSAVVASGGQRIRAADRWFDSMLAGSVAYGLYGLGLLEIQLGYLWRWNNGQIMSFLSRQIMPSFGKFFASTMN